MNNDLVAINYAVARLDETVTGLEQENAALHVAVDDLHAEMLELQREALQPKPSGLTRVLANLNKSTAWIQAGAKGNTDPKPTDPVGTYIMTPGDEANWYCAAVEKWGNSYWYQKRLNESGERFIYPFEIRIMTQAEIDACNKVEIEWQMNKDDRVYNMAFQNDPKGKGFWNTFIYNGGKPLLDANGKRLNSWPPTSIPATKFVPGVWVKIVAEFYCDTVNHTVTHVSLTIDGKMYPVGITRDAFPLVQGDYVSLGFQLDSLGVAPPPPFNVKTRNMNPIY
jgi:hypothetical protein